MLKLLGNPSTLPRVPENAGHRVLLAVGTLGFSAVIVQLTLMREFLAAFSGNEMVLGLVLGSWLLLMGIGTWLGSQGSRLGSPLAVMAALQVLVALLPLAQVFCLRVLRNAVFLRGASLGMNETAATALLLLLPYCVVAGLALALGCVLLGNLEGPRGVGRAYVADSLGGIAGGILFSFFFVRFFDHLAVLVVPAGANLLAAYGLLQAVKPGSPFTIVTWFPLPRFKPGVSRGAAAIFVLAAALLATVLWKDFDNLSTRLQYRGQEVLARLNSPYGRLLVTRMEGQVNLLENGVVVASSHDEQRIEETVHYAMAQRPGARRVLLIGGGFSGTTRELLKYGLPAIDYVELDPSILRAGQKYLAENLGDPRIRLHHADGRAFLRQCTEKFDVALLDVPAPATAQYNRFYTVEFFAELKRLMTREGVVSFSLGHYENYVSPELARLLASARASVQAVFTNVLLLPGGRVYIVASDGPLTATELANRLARVRIPTRLVNRNYLTGMFTTDRLADLARASAQPASINRDFSPNLYFLHLRQWMSQFQSRPGPLHWLLLVLLAIYLARLRGPVLLLFASGFAASSLELVLLLAFQIVCGSVYYQVGIIVTVFMAGLALGGGIANCLSPSRRLLVLLTVLIAAYALLLAALLPALNHAAASALPGFALSFALGLLTLLLAMLVGMQFPLANRLHGNSFAEGVSRLYTADFVGAFLGALLVCTLLIPMAGVTGACLLTAALNLMAAGLAATSFKPGSVIR